MAFFALVEVNTVGLIDGFDYMALVVLRRCLDLCGVAPI